MTVGNTSSCGVRRNCSVVRRAVWPVAVAKRAPGARGVAGEAARPGAAIVSVVVVIGSSIDQAASAAGAGSPSGRGAPG
jgi:hypothetical protein